MVVFDFDSLISTSRVYKNEMWQKQWQTLSWIIALGFNLSGKGWYEVITLWLIILTLVRNTPKYWLIYHFPSATVIVLIFILLLLLSSSSYLVNLKVCLTCIPTTSLTGCFSIFQVSTTKKSNKCIWIKNTSKSIHQQRFIWCWLQLRLHPFFCCHPPTSHPHLAPPSSSSIVPNERERETKKVCVCFLAQLDWHEMTWLSLRNQSDRWMVID